MLSWTATLSPKYWNKKCPGSSHSQCAAAALDRYLTSQCPGSNIWLTSAILTWILRTTFENFSSVRSPPPTPLDHLPPYSLVAECSTPAHARPASRGCSEHGKSTVAGEGTDLRHWWAGSRDSTVIRLLICPGRTPCSGVYPWPTAVKRVWLLINWRLAVHWRARFARPFGELRTT